MAAKIIVFSNYASTKSLATSIALVPDRPNGLGSG